MPCIKHQWSVTPPQAVLDSTESLVVESAKHLEALVAGRIHADLQEAMADVSSSTNQIAELVSNKADAEAELKSLPSPGAIQILVALLFLVGAAVAFFTELKLTDALVDLLGYRRDDPTGRAIGAAFASTMLVFELIFTRLALVSDPWELLFSRAQTKGLRWLHVAGGACLILTLIGIAWLQIVTVIKMAPTRSIDALYQREQRGLTAHEKQAVEDSTLFFSVCVLISGGFMAAAATKELSFWWRRRVVATSIDSLEATRLHAIVALNNTEIPTLASELEKFGIPCTWLSGAPLDDLANRLSVLLSSSQPGTGTRAVAASEARAFESAKRVNLHLARAKPDTAHQPKSWRETVDDALGAMAA